MDLSLKEVIDNNFCIGCAACTYANESIQVVRDKNGKNQALLNENIETSTLPNSICPFASSKRNEDYISNIIYGMQDGIKHSPELGHYLESYIGFVKKGLYREQGSSGGVANWIVAKLLEDNLIDAVIHVKDGYDENMYSYQISNSIEDLHKGAKSKYYPIEMSEVLDIVKRENKRYAIIGVPCFIKAVRLLQQDFPELRDRIVFCIGLVCGHLKSDFFAKSEAWESGINPEELKRVDFRYKLPGKKASNYAIEAKGIVDGQEKTIVKLTRNLSTTNWGYGFFKYEACDYCDDVLAELADITVGDAWLPKYVEDNEGTNIIICRNQELLNVFTKYRSELKLFDTSEEEIVQSQAGGFRHRREGLSYRLWLKEQAGEVYPTKRVSPSSNISEKRKVIYKERIDLIDQSFIAYHLAKKEKDFDVFIQHMKPIIKKYRKIAIPFKSRVKDKLKSALSKVNVG